MTSSRLLLDSYVHSLVHQHLHMHAFTPILHRSLTTQPAPMYNVQLPRAAARPSFAPVTAFHRATQKPFRSKKRGRWGALHVCIAWKIYYHEQLKKMQQKPNSLHQELTPEHLASCQPDRVQHKGSEHPNIDSPCRPSAYGNTGDGSETGKTAENLSHVNKGFPSDLFTPSHRHMTKREEQEQEQAPNLLWREKLDEKEKQAETTQDLPFRDKCWDLTTTPEADGRRSLDRKRQLESHGSIRVKRMKQDVVDNTTNTLHTDPSLFSTTHTHPSSHTIPVQHISDLCVMYPSNSRWNVTRTPGTLEMHPYQAASMWDLHSRQKLLQDYSLNTCKAIRIPLAVHRQKEACHGFFSPSLYFPLALRQQESVYLRGSHGNGHLHHPGYLATSYMGL